MRYLSFARALTWVKNYIIVGGDAMISCHDFVDNQVRLQLFALAYNLGNFLRCLASPKSVKKWSLRTLREKLIKIEAEVVRHSRYIVFQMAEVAVPKALFREILDRIRQLRSLTLNNTGVSQEKCENVQKCRS